MRDRFSAPHPHTKKKKPLWDSNGPKGNWNGVFSHNLGITNSLATESWGLRDGLLLARDLNICKLIVEIGAKSVMHLLKPENIGNTESNP